MWGFFRKKTVIFKSFSASHWISYIRERLEKEGIETFIEHNERKRTVKILVWTKDRKRAKKRLSGMKKKMKGRFMDSDGSKD